MNDIDYDRRSYVRRITINRLLQMNSCVAGLRMDEAPGFEPHAFHDLSQTTTLAKGTRSFRDNREADFKGR